METKLIFVQLRKTTGKIHLHVQSNVATATGVKTADGRVGLMFLSSFAGTDASNDVALYSGLAAGIIAVAILAAAVVLYRKNHSEYGVDAIDSSALASGFQSFNFKTARQGEEAGGYHDDGCRAQTPQPNATSERRTWQGREVVLRRGCFCNRGNSLFPVERVVGVMTHAGGR